MSFGLRNAPGSFQKLMNVVLARYLDRFCKVYLDDVIVYSDILEQHEEHLENVLERFHADKENKPQEKHIGRILEIPTTKKLRQVRVFL